MNYVPLPCEVCGKPSLSCWSKARERWVMRCWEHRTRGGVEPEQETQAA